jgi:hypothetical protein
MGESLWYSLNRNVGGLLSWSGYFWEEISLSSIPEMNYHSLFRDMAQ